jgi:hypothetical protein
MPNCWCRNRHTNTLSSTAHVQMQGVPQNQHKGPADHVSAANIFPQPSPERIFLSTLDTAYQITLGSPVPGPTSNMGRVAGLPEIVM